MPYKRKVVIGASTLYLGNALDIMKAIDPVIIEPVDLLCTDAPYLVTAGGNVKAWAAGAQVGAGKPGASKARPAGFGGWMKRGYTNNGEIVKCNFTWSDWMPDAFRLLKTGRQAYFMTNGENEARARIAAEDCGNLYDADGRLIKKDGFKFHTLLAWDKRAAMPGRYYQNVTEFTLFMRKGRAFTITDPSSKNLFSQFQRDQSAHPTEKPVDLMMQYIGNSSKRGWTVLDPFMGSGTTGVAAARLGRRFIGIEIEEKWFDVACERIAAANEQSHLFEEAEPVAPAVQMCMLKEGLGL